MNPSVRCRQRDKCRRGHRLQGLYPEGGFAGLIRAAAPHLRLQADLASAEEIARLFVALDEQLTRWARSNQVAFSSTAQALPLPPDIGK